MKSRTKPEKANKGGRPKKERPRMADRALCVYLERDMDDRLRLVVEKAGRPLAVVVRDALGAYLDAVEPRLPTMEALRRPTLAPVVKG